MNASVWRRIATLFAGPFANFIIAYILAVVLVSFSAWNFPVINELTEDSAAQEAGMQPGDKIISVDGEKVYIIDVNPRASRSVPFLSKSTGL